PAVSTILQVLFEFNLLIAFERSQGIECEVFGESAVHTHGFKAFRKASRPARMRVLIVPSGSPVLVAISVWVRPSKNAISRACRCAGCIPLRTSRTSFAARDLSASDAGTGATERTMPC